MWIDIMLQELQGAFCGLRLDSDNINFDLRVA